MIEGGGGQVVLNHTPPINFRLTLTQSRTDAACSHDIFLQTNS